MTATKSNVSPRLYLKAATAQDVMTDNPLSLEQDATVLEAAGLLLDKNISAAPVINEAGHPVGMLSRTDLVRHQRETQDLLQPEDRMYRAADLHVKNERLTEGFEIISGDRTCVRDIMTPTVFTVPPKMSIDLVVKEMLRHKVHHLCVIDRFGVLVGIISTLDILRALEV
jgi:predicted transcriptional regulator